MERIGEAGPQMALMDRLPIMAQPQVVLLEAGAVVAAVCLRMVQIIQTPLVVNLSQMEEWVV